MKTSKLALIGAVVALTAMEAWADHTNLVETLQFRLLGLRQGPTRTNGNEIVTTVDTVRLDSKDIIQSLAAATGNSFSRRGRLVLVTPLEGGNSSVQVRDGSDSVDVTAFFANEQSGTPIVSAASNRRNGHTTQATYSIQRFVLQETQESAGLNLRFELSGFAIDSITNPARRGAGNGLEAHVSGTGDRNGSPLVIDGDVSTSNQTLEVESDGGGVAT